MVFGKRNRLRQGAIAGERFPTGDNNTNGVTLTPVTGCLESDGVAKVEHSVIGRALLETDLQATLIIENPLTLDIGQQLGGAADVEHINIDPTFLSAVETPVPDFLNFELNSPTSSTSDPTSDSDSP